MASRPSEGLSCGNLCLQNSKWRPSHHVAVGALESSDNEAGCLIISHEACRHRTSEASMLPSVCLCTHSSDHTTKGTQKVSLLLLLWAGACKDSYLLKITFLLHVDGNLATLLAVVCYSLYPRAAILSPFLTRVSVRHLFVMHLPSALHLTQQAVGPQVSGKRRPSEHRFHRGADGGIQRVVLN
ncbi:hypothetical protein EYF80_002454 [Liparis tanakae]|uniref:Uncharacterized protein n=1 Tax=Liparis tanakae TaxID=230148 RepID=A0A4Z2JD95_9TELE|nr:hypothetical protein EYF80_002454 [Liparis tanakae]